MGHGSVNNRGQSEKRLRSAAGILAVGERSQVLAAITHGETFAIITHKLWNDCCELDILLKRKKN